MANPKRRLIRIGLMAAAALGIGIIALIALPDRKPAPAVPDLAIADSLLQPLPADSSAAVR
ncbi:hypothetical protein KJ815_13175, partial [bacterium]|nr:hypothetical protein [bacterium]